MSRTHFPIARPSDVRTPKKSARSIRRRNRGFTLVELMVAMALLGVLTSIIYGLFHTTSQTLLEVESLAETIDTARFALEHVGNDLQAAGSQASPKSAKDPWVVPGSSRHVTGIVPYANWQGTTPYPTGAPNSDMAKANTKSRFDGIVVIGAYDIPQSIMLRDVQPSPGNSEAVVAEHVRGLPRLLDSDPFNPSATPSADIATRLEAAQPQLSMPNRILRITDRQGFLQFTPILAANISSDTIKLTLGSLQAATGDTLVGIDEVSEDDVEYEAAFLDGFWYHVIVDPFDPTNYQLVRDRLNLTEVNLKDYATFNPASYANIGQVPIERVVIANRVVDFRLWFDCGDPTSGRLSEVAWHNEWDSPETSGNINACLATKLELARVAHIRLSVRTANESANRQHFTIHSDWPGFEIDKTRMQTYDIEPSVPGAASVVTVQTTVELANFATRNLLAIPTDATP